MLQTVMSLMLAAVQVLAWNAAPVYLCLDAEGSACVDRGPAFCDCCRSESEHDRAGHDRSRRCDHSAHCEHQSLSSPCGADGEIAEPPCGCRHEQISDAQVAVRGQDRDAVPLDAAVVPPAMFPVTTRSQHAIRAAAPRAPASSDALAARAGVVLRI